MANNNIDNLLISQSEVKWNENDEPLQERGVTGGWIFNTLLEIQELRNKISMQYESQMKAANWRDEIPEPDYPALDGEFTARSLVREHIIPWTKDLSAPLYARIPYDLRGKPTLFLSYTWDSGFFSHGYGVMYTVQRLMGSEYIWMDVFCHNQHNVGNVSKQMEAVISGIEKIVVPMSEFPWYKRVWCIWEVICALRYNKEIVFLEYYRKHRDYLTIHKYFLNNFSSISLAVSTRPEDKEEILFHVKNMFGSINEADKYLKGVMSNYLQKFQ